MKRVITILYTLAIVALASCTKSGDELSSINIGGEVTFNIEGEVASRSAQDQKEEFGKDDQIGVFMDDASKSLSTNVEYKILEDADDNSLYLSGEKIFYPSSGDVYCYAYSPYQSGLTTNTIPVNLSSDSYEFLVTDKITSSAKKAKDGVTLAFKHALSLIKITYTPTIEYSELKSVKVNSYTESDYSFDDKTFTLTNSTKSDISFEVTTTADSKQVAEVVLIPGDYATDKLALSFEFVNNGSTVTKTLDLAVALESGYIHPYTLTLGLDEPALTAGNITAWTTTTNDSTSTGKYIGDGTADTPWAIYTQADFANIGKTDHKFELNDDYILMNDIEFTFEGDDSWTPIGPDSNNHFGGDFNGGGHLISGLKVSTGSSNYAGLFGEVNNGAVYNLGVSGEVSGRYAAGVVGHLVSSGKVYNCYNMCTVHGVARSSYAGGVVGQINGGTVSNCYNIGSVTAEAGVVFGGVAGRISGKTAQMVNCYWDSAKTTKGVGQIANTPIVVDDTPLTAEQIGLPRFADWMENGAVGLTNACAWKYDATNKRPVFDSENQPVKTDPDITVTNDSTTERLNITLNNSDYEIRTGYGLRAFADLVNGAGANTCMAIVSDPKHFDFAKADDNSVIIKDSLINGKIVADIDLSEVCGEKLGNWVPIGWNATRVRVSQYSGTFDGQGHTISNLYIKNSSGVFEAGLFGSVFTTAEISNINVDGEIEVSESGFVGGIAGAIFEFEIDATGVDAYPVIYNCHSSVNIKAADIETGGDEKGVGGIVGYVSGGEILNCYNSGSVNGGYNTGGIVGFFKYSIYINNCYNVGAVTAEAGVMNGGIIGNIYDEYASGCNLVSCFWSSDKAARGVGSSIYDSTQEYLANARNDEGMKSGEVLELLNNGAYTIRDTESLYTGEKCTAYAWESSDATSPSDGYPVFNTTATPVFTFYDIVYSGDVYYIYSEKGLRAFANLVNGVPDDLGASYDTGLIDFTSSVRQPSLNGKLGDDITLSDDEWTPIADIPGVDNVYAYTGTFDGNGKTVSNLTIKNAEKEYQGFFGYITAGAVSNLTVKGDITSSQDYVGGIAGRCYRPSGKLYKIENCVSYVNVSGKAYVGGIVGSTDISGLKKCGNHGTVRGSSSYVGGIAGNTYNCYLADCYNKGSVVGEGNVGGGVGYSQKTTVYSLYNQGSVTNTDSGGYTGGLFGFFESSTSGMELSLYNLYNTGALSGGNIGGLAGKIGLRTKNVFLKNSYWIDSVTNYYAEETTGTGVVKETNVGKKSDVEMKDQGFVADLNTSKNGASDGYKFNNGGYPVLSWEVITD